MPATLLLACRASSAIIILSGTNSSFVKWKEALDKAGVPHNPPSLQHFTGYS
jgi:hypothetical protein